MDSSVSASALLPRGPAVFRTLSEMRPHIARLTTLDIQFTAASFMSPDAQRFLRGPFSNLSSLTLIVVPTRSQSDNPTLLFSDYTFPSLVELTVDGAAIRIHHNSDLMKIHVLRLRNYPAQQPTMSFHDFLRKHLGSARDLETLELTNYLRIAHENPPNNMTSTSFPHMQRLVVKDTVMRTRLFLSYLHHLPARVEVSAYLADPAREGGLCLFLAGVPIHLFKNHLLQSTSAELAIKDAEGTLRLTCTGTQSEAVFEMQVQPRTTDGLINTALTSAGMVFVGTSVTDLSCMGHFAGADRRAWLQLLVCSRALRRLLVMSSGSDHGLDARPLADALALPLSDGAVACRGLEVLCVSGAVYSADLMRTIVESVRVRRGCGYALRRLELELKPGTEVGVDRYGKAVSRPVHVQDAEENWQIQLSGLVEKVCITET